LFNQIGRLFAGRVLTAGCHYHVRVGLVDDGVVDECLPGHAVGQVFAEDVDAVAHYLQQFPFLVEQDFECLALDELLNKFPCLS